MIGSRYCKHSELGFDERLDPASTALVVIDVQNDFAIPQGVCGLVGDDISPVAPMVEHLKELIQAAREARLLIVFVRTIYDDVVLSPTLAEQYLRRGYPNSICVTGTRGAEFYDGIGPRDAPNEILVTKHRYSAFWGSSIDLVLRTNGIRTLVLTGIATEVCVESTARDAFFRDYQVVVPSDCVGCYSEERQQASLSVLARSFGIVTPSEEIASTWRKLGNGPRNWQPERQAARNLVGLASQLDPQHTAVLVLRGRSEILAARGDAATARLVEDARRAGCVVIHACPAGSENETALSSELKAELSPLGDEQIVRYHRASAFADTQLDILLRSNCIRTLVIAGSETNVEVESTVRDAADNDYYPVVIEDCVFVSETERDLHESSLATMRRHFATVVRSNEARSHWVRPNSSISGARAE